MSSSCSANCPGGQQTQGFSYVYDRYANRWQQNVTAGSGPQPTATFNNTKNQLDGYSYDADGNLLNDGAHSYTYDAESRIIAVDGGATATYVYDAEGRRVQKTTASGTVGYVYDIAGEQVADVNSGGGANREEVYAGGKHLATYVNGTTYFNHADWLGTERMRTSVSGSSCETIVSLAFGDGTATSGSCSDASPMHFTGKQSDPESGLDDFDARYYSSEWGRFISVDPIIVNGNRLRDPQQFNRYAYVRDSPLRLTDPTGETLELSGDVAADKNDLCQIVGSDACSRISVSDNGAVSFDTEGLKLNSNEGATLLDQLVRSQNTYALVVSQTENTQGGTVDMSTHTGVESNLDNTQDSRYGNGKSATDLPPKGVDDQVTLNPVRQYADSQDRPVSQAMVAFHELAEAYAKVDEGKPYGDYYRQDVVKPDLVEISPPQQGAHNEAVQREQTLRQQRPSLQSTGRAGDDVHLIRDPHN